MPSEDLRGQKPRMYSKSFEVNLRVYYKGKFDFVKGRIEYVGGAVNLSCGLSSSTINVKFLRDVALKFMGRESEIWYRTPGSMGKRMIVSEYDVVNLLKSRDKSGMVCVYLIQPFPSPSPSIRQSPRANVVQRRLLSNSMPTSMPTSHPTLMCTSKPTTKPTLQPTFTFTSPRQLIPSTKANSLTLRRSPRNKVTQYAEKTHNIPSNSLEWREKLPIKRHLSFVDNGRNQLTTNKGKSSGEKKTQSKALAKTREKRKIPSEEFDEDDFDNSDSDGSDINISDIEWQVGEEDCNDVEELFDDNNRSGLVDNVEESLESLDFARPGGETKAQQAHIWGVDDLEVDVNSEQEYDSDDFRSLQGSDNEVDPYHTFNADIEFKKPVCLNQGLKFANVQLFRKALISHSVENGYDFYYGHNGSKKVSAYCKYRCKCPWNAKRSRLGKCNCVKKNECGFRVYAVKLDGEETFQIRTLNLKHKCPMSRYNRKVSSEYLAEKFLEFWRTNIDWKLKHFRDHVLKELNVHVSYGKCWLARARAKLIIYGNGRDQYAKIWAYAAAIRKYNQGSSAFVVCDNIERPPVYFKRIYICLEACKEGFSKGCRPILGIDGCHLKGAYPGMCLVAVGKDGNNNIYPVAWAVVEVENADTWRWFIELHRQSFTILTLKCQVNQA